jgi:hypothetical protein
MRFLKLSHPKSIDQHGGDFFINSDFVVRILPKESGSILILRDGASVPVEQDPDTIAAYADDVAQPPTVSRPQRDGQFDGSAATAFSRLPEI